MNVVLFAPEDLQLIKGSPAGRREFIDIELGQMKPLYLSDLSQYNMYWNKIVIKNSENWCYILEVLDYQLHAEFLEVASFIIGRFIKNWS